MYKITFSIKRKNPGREGMVRMIPISKDKEKRFKAGQLVLTDEGLGTIQPFLMSPGKDSKGAEIEVFPNIVSVFVRNIKHRVRMFGTSKVFVINIVDNKTGEHYPATESDYNLLVIEDTPVKFTVTRLKKAMLTDETREKLSFVKMYSKKQNGVKILKELTEKGYGIKLK